MRILVFNCGSSSLKFEMLELASPRDQRGRIIGRGLFERVGTAQTEAVLTAEDGAVTRRTLGACDHRGAAGHAVAWLEQLAGQPRLELEATAHRVVHGGPHIFVPTLLDDVALRELDEATALAPLHNPPAIATIRAVRERLPGVPAIVIADTGFHRELPDYARTYALPRDLTRRHGIRRFGFHGLGHAWMTGRYAELTGADSATLNLITLHLGAGCSATAIRGGKSVDTSMGQTPLEGLMMATRSGDLDPAIVTLLCEREGITPQEVESMLNHRSGLLGVSAISGDIRDVQGAADGGNADATLALEMFCYRVRKYIGQYLAVPGKTAAIIFGGGIGEHADRIRARICAGLEHLGIVCDDTRNRAANGREQKFSADESLIQLYVIPVDEELYMARAAASLLAQSHD
ncbi:MAG: acetate/propionate family kinase [Candidatus Binataceae bacterium]